MNERAFIQASSDMCSFFIQEFARRSIGTFVFAYVNRLFQSQPLSFHDTPGQSRSESLQALRSALARCIMNTFHSVAQWLACEQNRLHPLLRLLHAAEFEESRALQVEHLLFGERG